VSRNDSYAYSNNGLCLQALAIEGRLGSGNGIVRISKQNPKSMQEIHVSSRNISWDLQIIIIINLYAAICW
jgi:hypothetical protein